MRTLTRLAVHLSLPVAQIRLCSDLDSTLLGSVTAQDLGAYTFYVCLCGVFVRDFTRGFVAVGVRANCRPHGRASRRQRVRVGWRGVGLASGVAQLIMQVDKLSNNIILFALYFPRTKYMYHRHHCLRGPLALRLSASTWENPLSARGLGSNLPALRCI